MSVTRHTLLALTTGLLLMCGLTPAFADEPASATVAADAMIHCALLNAQAVKEHGEEAAFISAKNARMFIGLARALTNEDYVVEQIDKGAPTSKRHAKGDTKEVTDRLNTELDRCSKMDFSPAIHARLQMLVEEKKSHE